MGGSTFLTTLSTMPLTCTVMCICIVIFFVQWNRRYGYESVFTSYEKVVRERQYYRIISATFCHLNLMHLVFNMGSLYAVGVLETALGSLYYLETTFLLIFVSEALWLLISYVLVERFNMARFATTSAVGYSGVIFGWMTVLQLYQPSFSIALPGFSIPIAIAPFISLFITQLLIPTASFLGHLSGIFAGYAIGLGAFGWLTGYWLYAVVAILSTVCLLSLKANRDTSHLIACISVSPEFLSSTGVGGNIAMIDDAADAATRGRRYISGGILRPNAPPIDISVRGEGVDALRAAAAPPAAVVVAGASSPTQEQLVQGSGTSASVAGGSGGSGAAAVSNPVAAGQPSGASLLSRTWGFFRDVLGRVGGGTGGGAGAAAGRYNRVQNADDEELTPSSSPPPASEPARTAPPLP